MIAWHCNVFQELKYIGLYFTFHSPLKTFDRHPTMERQVFPSAHTWIREMSGYRVSRVRAAHRVTCNTLWLERLVLLWDTALAIQMYSTVFSLICSTTARKRHSKSSKKSWETVSSVKMWREMVYWWRKNTEMLSYILRAAAVTVSHWGRD